VPKAVDKNSYAATPRGDAIMPNASEVGKMEIFEQYLAKFLWLSYAMSQAIVFLSWVSSFFFSSPNFNRRRLDIYHTSIHGVRLVRI